MKRGYNYAHKYKVAPLKKFVGQAAPKTPRTSNAIAPLQLVLAIVLSFFIGVILTLSMASPEVVRRIQHKESLY